MARFGERTVSQGRMDQIITFTIQALRLC